MVEHGFLYVNFEINVNPFYRIKDGDSVFFYADVEKCWRYRFWRRYLFVNSFRSYGSIKFLSGHRLFKDKAPIRLKRSRVGLKWRRFLNRNKKFVTKAKLNTSMKTGLVSLRSVLKKLRFFRFFGNLQHHFFFLEVSRKIKFFVNINVESWFFLSFSNTIKSEFCQFPLVNRAINFSYW
jgi:hypothetical protein